MKTVYSLILGMLIFTMSACKKETNHTPTTPTGTTDSFLVTVVNGYGSGMYKAGDTVHIFSKELAENQLFDGWSSTDISLLNGSNEWHTWFIMPAKEMNFTCNLQTIQAFTLQYEQIQGSNMMKPVYSFFPAHHKGIVYLLHGTGGSASALLADYDWQLLIKKLVNDKFAVIITEAEEATANTDMNGDGKIRWNSLPYDTLSNVDFANIRIITDTFCKRGITNAGIPKYSIGMSNGGNFSTVLSTIYSYKSGVSFCAPSGNPIAQNTTTPILFCMARFDNNPNVGPAGNANALNDANTISGRGICSNYLIKERSPLYPERFARKGDISLTQSAAIFNELKANNLLDTGNYFRGYADALVTAVSANPSAFPRISSLSTAQFFSVRGEISLAVSDHKMYSDYNSAVLKFLNTQCQ